MKRRPLQGSALIVGGVDSAALSDPPTFRTDCPCPKSGCALHGRCTECRAKHGRKGRLARCER
jgi:hypothetical protein